MLIKREGATAEGYGATGGRGPQGAGPIEVGGAIETKNRKEIRGAPAFEADKLWWMCETLYQYSNKGTGS